MVDQTQRLEIQQGRSVPVRMALALLALALLVLALLAQPFPVALKPTISASVEPMAH